MCGALGVESSVFTSKGVARRRSVRPFTSTLDEVNSPAWPWQCCQLERAYEELKPSEPASSLSLCFVHSLDLRRTQAIPINSVPSLHAVGFVCARDAEAASVKRNPASNLEIGHTPPPRLFIHHDWPHHRTPTTRSAKATRYSTPSSTFIITLHDIPLHPVQYHAVGR